MKRIRRYLVFGIAFLALVMIGGCQVKEQNSPELSETETDPATAEPGMELRTVELIRGGKTDFTVVIPRSAGVSLKRTAERLAESFSAVGIPIAVKNDGGAFASDIPADTYEILLGNTNRAESRGMEADRIPAQGYLCCATARRIAFKAADDGQLDTAVLSWFGRMLGNLQDGNLTAELPAEERVDWSGAREGWLLWGIPAYEGGTLSALYDCGYGMYDYSEDPADNSVMQTVSGTDADGYLAYLTKLADAGYRPDSENRIGDNRYALYTLGGLRVYVYYTASTGTVRVIRDKNSTVPLSEFGYSYVAQAGDDTVFYAYALCQSDTGLYSNNCGQLDVIKLADNSLFVIDGGMAAQFDEAARQGFVEFAYRVTGTPEGEKVRISCWFFTHDHGDHRDGLAQVLASPAYASFFTVERLAFNFPATSVGVNGNTKDFLATMSSMYPDCQMLKLHTGMKFSLANLQIETVATHEDLANRNGTSNIRDFNDSSTVLKISAEGVELLLLGDTSNLSERSIVSAMPADYLAVDIVQVAHHTWNNLSNLYDLTRAPYAVFTQTEGASNRTLGIYAKAVLRKIQEYAAPEHCWFSGEKTTGLLLSDGTVTVKEEIPLCWNTPDYPWTYVYEGWDMSKVKDYADEEH